ARRQADLRLRRTAERSVPRFAHRVAAGARDTSADRAEVEALRSRVGELERYREVVTMSAWLPHAVVPEDFLISVVMPTRNRRELLAEAIESVEQQSYTRW